VLKLTLQGGYVAAFKPRSALTLGDTRYRGEIAAYRLARALGLDNVPRAIPRTFSASTLRTVCSAPAAAQFERLARIDPDGNVRGALIPWIENYEELALQEPSWRTKWLAWLTEEQHSIDERDRPLAAAISTMLVFDYVTANWDRWSGGNIARNAATGTLLFVDNDGAFYEHPSQDALLRQLARLRTVIRFSHRLVAALRSLDDAKLRAAVGEESPGKPLLSDAVLAQLSARRLAVLAVVSERIARAGEQATLAFD
jgi:hypothetical protein